MDSNDYLKIGDIKINSMDDAVNLLIILIRNGYYAEVEESPVKSNVDYYLISYYKKEV